MNLARYLPWKPEFVHVHDWQAGFVPLLILHQKLHDGWATRRAPASRFTISRIKAFSRRAQLCARRICLGLFSSRRRGVLRPHELFESRNRISPTCSRPSARVTREKSRPKIRLRPGRRVAQRQNALVGILNGVDYEEWNTDEQSVI